MSAGMDPRLPATTLRPVQSSSFRYSSRLIGRIPLSVARQPVTFLARPLYLLDRQRGWEENAAAVDPRANDLARLRMARTDSALRQPAA